MQLKDTAVEMAKKREQERQKLENLQRQNERVVTGTGVEAGATVALLQGIVAVLLRIFESMLCLDYDVLFV